MLVINLPPPISVNSTRRVDWRTSRRYAKWKIWADRLLMMHGGMPAHEPVRGQYAAVLTLDPRKTRCDMDNAVKAAIDYAVRLGLVEGDSPKHLRELTIKWGATQHGSTLSIVEYVEPPP